MAKVKELDFRDILKGDFGKFTSVLYWFFSFPTREISLSDLAEELSISKTTANKFVNELENLGFLKKEVLGKTWRISCNIQHPFNRLKIPYSLTLIYSSEIIGDIYKKIASPRVIILFGSYRKGDDNDKSDVDIAVEVLGNESLKIIELGKYNLGLRKNVTVNIHVFSRSKIDLNLFANIANGIILDGFLEVRP